MKDESTYLQFTVVDHLQKKVILTLEAEGMTGQVAFQLPVSKGVSVVQKLRNADMPSITQVDHNI